MPQFQAINVPQPVTPSPAKNNFFSTSVQRSGQMKPAIHTRWVEAKNNIVGPTTKYASRNEFESTQLPRLQLHQQVSSSTHRTPMTFEHVVGSRALAREPLSTNKSRAGEHSTNDAPTSPESVDFPAIETLFAQSQCSIARKILPNREKRVMPPVEQDISRSNGQATSEAKTITEFSSLSARRNTKGFENGEAANQTTRSRTHITASDHEIPKHVKRNEFSALIRSEAPANPVTPSPQGISDATDAVMARGLTTSKCQPVTPQKSQPKVSVKSEPLNNTPTNTTRHRTVTKKGTALQIYTPRTSRRKLREDGILELPKEEYGLEVIESTRKQLKQMQRCLLSQEQMLQEQKRQRELKAIGGKKRPSFTEAKKERRMSRKKRRVSKIGSRKRSGDVKTADNNVLAGNGSGDVTVTARARQAPTEPSRGSFDGLRSNDAMSGSSQERVKEYRTANTGNSARGGAAKFTNEHGPNARQPHHKPSQGPDEDTRSGESTSVREKPQLDTLEITKPSNDRAKDAPRSEKPMTDTGSHGKAQVSGGIPKPQTSSSSVRKARTLQGLGIIFNVNTNTSHQKKPGKSDHGSSGALLPSQNPLRPESSYTQQRPGNPKESIRNTASSNTESHTNRSWATHLSRREVVMPNNRPQCRCDSLHSYFQKALFFEPKLNDFPGCKAEFLAHAEQVAKCEAHSKILRRGCQQILEKESQISAGQELHAARDNSATADKDIEPVFDFANGFLSRKSLQVWSQPTMPPPNSGASSHRPSEAEIASSSRPEIRAQSIIPPWEFYGHEHSHPPPKDQAKSRPPLSSPLKHRGITRPTNLQQDSILDLEDTHSRSSSSPGAEETTSNTRKAVKPIFDSKNSNSDHHGQRDSPSLSFRTLPFEEADRNTNLRRHQSLPARTRRNETYAVSATDQQAPNNPKDLVSLVDNIVRKRLADHAITTVEPRMLEPPPPKKRKMSVAERKLRDPPLSKDVPLCERKTDTEILRVAKYINPYDRHRRAPYAFRYSGQFYAEYKHLRVAIGNNRRPVLTAEELSRL